MGGIDYFVLGIANSYSSFIASLPAWLQQAINLFLWVIIIFIYAIILWKFHKLIARKNIFSLNLTQYNRSEHPIFSKVIGGTLYLVEYLLILPFLILIWFSVFSIALILLTEQTDVSKITFISAVIIGAIRLLSYTRKYGKTLAEEIAKLIPLTLLAITMINPDFVFDFSRVIGNLSQIPYFFSKITIYILFIISLEMFLRIIDFIISLIGIEDRNSKEQD